MTMAELNILKRNILERKQKNADMDVLVSALLKLPPGQLKKLLKDEVLAVLEKYGYTEG